VRCVLAAVEQKRVHILCEKHKIVQRAWRVWRQVASSEATWRRPANCTKFNNHGCPPHPLARIAAALRLEGHESIDTEIHLISLGCPETAEYHPAIHPAIHTHKHTHKHTHTHTHTHMRTHTTPHTASIAANRTRRQRPANICGRSHRRRGHHSASQSAYLFLGPSASSLRLARLQRKKALRDGSNQWRREACISRVFLFFLSFFFLSFFPSFFPSSFSGLLPANRTCRYMHERSRADADRMCPACRPLRPPPAGALLPAAN